METLLVDMDPHLSATGAEQLEIDMTQKTQNENKEQARRRESSELRGFVSRDEIQRLRDIAMKATPGKWRSGGFECEDYEEAVSICDQIILTDVSTLNFMEVWCKDGRRTALVGNGPNAKENSEHIEAFSPETAIRLLDALESALFGQD